MAAARNIPSVNLDDYRSGTPERRTQMIDTLGAGLVEFGFLNVEAHGVDAAVIRKTYDLWRRFFDLPEEEKRRYVASGSRGFTPFGVEHAKDNPTPDLKEFYHVGQEPDAAAALPDDHPGREPYPPNVWPASIPGIRDTTVDLYRRLEATARILLEALAEYFGLPRRQLADMTVHGNSLLRILHYPALGEGVPPGAVRAAEHEDINLITLLCEATDSGLEILTREGEWLPVETGPGEIVVDAGDMLSRHLNGVVPATTHRVVNPGDAGRERYSMPFFVHPYSKADLSVLPRFVTDDQPAKYPPISAGDFLNQRLAEIGLKA